MQIFAEKPMGVYKYSGNPEFLDVPPLSHKFMQSHTFSSLTGEATNVM